MNMTISSIQRLLLYLAFITSFTYTLGFAPSLGPFMLMPFRILVLCCWGLMVVEIIMNNGSWDLSHIKVKRYLLLFALWLAYALLSIMWAADQEAAAKHIFLLALGFSVIFLLVYYLWDLNSLKRLYWLWLIIFIVLLIVAQWEMSTGHHLKLSKLYVESRWWMMNIPTTVFYNENDFATFLALSLPMVVTWIRYSPKLFSRILGMVVFLFGLYILLRTTSRANYIAFFMGFSFWFAFLIKHNKKTLIRTAWFALFFLLVFGGEFLQTVTSQIGSLTALGGDNSIYNVAEDVSVRKNLLKNAIFIIGDSFPFGVGAGNAEYYLMQYKIYSVGGIINLHNWWAEILVNYGVLIFAGYVFVYLNLIYNLWMIHGRLKDDSEKMICEALLTGWVGFSMASISSSALIGFAPQWLYLGFILAFINYYIRNAAISREKLSQQAFYRDAVSTD